MLLCIFTMPLLHSGGKKKLFYVLGLVSRTEALTKTKRNLKLIGEKIVRAILTIWFGRKLCNNSWLRLKKNIYIFLCKNPKHNWFELRETFFFFFFTPMRRLNFTKFLRKSKICISLSLLTRSYTVQILPLQFSKGYIIVSLSSLSLS